MIFFFLIYKDKLLECKKYYYSSRNIIIDVGRGRPIYIKYSFIEKYKLKWNGNDKQKIEIAMELKLEKEKEIY